AEPAVQCVTRRSPVTRQITSPSRRRECPIHLGNTPDMESLEIRTGCRLHFGLMELAAGQPLRFGGMGLMLEEPGFVLRFSARPSTKAIPNGEIQRRVAAQLERQRGRDR